MIVFGENCFFCEYSRHCCRKTIILADCTVDWEIATSDVLEQGQAPGGTTSHHQTLAAIDVLAAAQSERYSALSPANSIFPPPDLIFSDIVIDCIIYKRQYIPIRWILRNSLIFASLRGRVQEGVPVPCDSVALWRCFPCRRAKVRRQSAGPGNIQLAVHVSHCSGQMWERFQLQV